MTKYEIRPIKTEEDHAWALGQIDQFWGSEEGTPEFEYLMDLSELVSKYEDEITRRNFPDREPQPSHQEREALSPEIGQDPDKKFRPLPFFLGAPPEKF